ncbi:MAG: sigma-54-dependent Fis family transcriptional regulator, partial [Bdellovibrionales bacterium]|nr:sigma-54-dependent Fis family transcriptional regulator [Bdellovibrionales bacterium]
PLRERKEDIAELTEHFLKQERPFRNTSLSSDAAMTLQAHSWPGNVRELKRVVEQVSLHSPLPILRAEDVRATLYSSQRDLAFPEEDLSAGLDQILKNYEKQVIASSIKKAADMEELTQILKISRSSLYKKIKDYGLPLGELK